MVRCWPLEIKLHLLVRADVLQINNVIRIIHKKAAQHFQELLCCAACARTLLLELYADANLLRYLHPVINPEYGDKCLFWVRGEFLEVGKDAIVLIQVFLGRSEERRVGKE